MFSSVVVLASCLDPLGEVAATSPPGVEVLDVNQFLPEDDVVGQLDDLRGTAMIASSTLVQIVVDVEEDDVPRLIDFTTNSRHNPHHDTGTTRKAWCSEFERRCPSTTP